MKKPKEKWEWDDLEIPDFLKRKPEKEPKKPKPKEKNERKER